MVTETIRLSFVASLLTILLSACAVKINNEPGSAKGSNLPTKKLLNAENEYYKLVTLPLPDDVVLEVGGLAHLSDGRIMAATRRGEVYIIENAYSDPAKPIFKRYAFGLAQPLGLLEHEGWIYVAQRGELSRMKDTNGDDKVDIIETVTDDWEISGNYHEYAFGPRLGPDGKLWITLNKPFGKGPFGDAHWRGWAVRVDTKTGKMEPMATGLRSPAGVEVSPWGDVFYTDNQGEWCNASKLSVIKKGDFHGHPWGLRSTPLPESPVKPLAEGLPKSGTFMKDLKKEIPNFKMPSVWFPYEKMGNSPSGLKWDYSEGKFGPFAGQLFVGDQTHASVMRVFLEEVDGHYQGAAFAFRRGLQSGVTRLAFAKDSSMFIGMTSRGWGGLGSDPYGLQRLVWTGKVPFETHEMRIKPDGFELTFTQPVDKSSASDLASYYMESYTYRLRKEYGGPEELKSEQKVTSATVSDDGKTIRLTVKSLRAGFVHELHLSGLRNTQGEPLLHDKAYYTVVNIPH
jgi:glucose/arabinose dehydrogenase